MVSFKTILVDSNDRRQLFLCFVSFQGTAKAGMSFATFSVKMKKSRLELQNMPEVPTSKSLMAGNGCV